VAGFRSLGLPQWLTCPRFFGPNWLRRLRNQPLGVLETMSTRDALVCVFLTVCRPIFTAVSQQWENGYDESVEVNQRALIDKVLARYSGEFTVFRELLQNSDDAQSKTVEIRFETRSFIDGRMGNLANSATLDNSLPDLKTSVVRPLIIA